MRVRRLRPATLGYALPARSRTAGLTTRGSRPRKVMHLISGVHVNEQQFAGLRADVHALLQQLQVHDQHLAASQGAMKALELVVNCLLLTHENPNSVREMIAHNAPKLFDGLAGDHLASATMRAILANVEGTISGELARRAAKSA